MLKKFFTMILCPMIVLPLFTAPISAAKAANDKSDDGIVGEWIWGSTVADTGAQKIVERSAAAGVTDLYLLVKGTGGKLGYLKTKYTDLLSRKDRDVLQETINAAHARGIRVHAWICNMEDATYKASHKEAGMWHYIRERDNDRINLYDEGYLEYMTTVAAELAAYDIDGIHLDYIRYNHLANGWSEKDLEALKNMGADLDRVRELIETTFGYHGKTANSNYVFNAYKNGDPDALIIGQYRRNNVKNYAKAIIEAARAVNPNLIFSAATMPEGAYNEAYGDLHYGQNYSDAAELYDYICPMAYSSSYGQSDTWVTAIAKNSIDKGNRVVMGLQAYEAATTERMMSEVANIRKLMNDKTYGNGTLGVVIFRNATFDYAKVTYDTEQKIITVKPLVTSQNYGWVRVDAIGGIKITALSVGEGFKSGLKEYISGSGSYAKISGSNIFSNGTEGYLYLKYEGEITEGSMPVRVSVSRGTEICTYNAYYATGDENADAGTPGTFEETTAEETTAAPEITSEMTSPEETSAEATAPETSAPASEGGCGSALAGAALTASVAAVSVLTKKKKRN